MNIRKLTALFSAAAISFSGVVAADAESVSYTYQASSVTSSTVTYSSAETLSTGYDGITLTLGADTYKYTADAKNGFSGRIAGSSNPNVSAGTGAYYSITLDDTVADGELTIGYQVGNGKNFYITDNGTAVSDEYNGVVFTEKTTATATFMVKGGHTYTMYASGSKAGFYGFTYRVVDKQSDFEKEIQGLTFDLIKGDNVSADAIDSSLDLPQAYESAFGSCDVAWTSSNTDIIANNGEVSLSTQAETVTLTGKFSVQEDDSLVQYKTYILTTIADNDDEAAVKAAADALTLGDISNVKKDIELPQKGKRQTSVSWSTSDASVITADGIVTRTPNEDTTALLTATITRNNATATKTFAVTVKGYVAVEFVNYVYTSPDGSNRFSPVDGGMLKSIAFTESIQNPTGEESFECIVYNYDGKIQAKKDISIKENSLGEDVLSTAEIDLPMDHDDTFVITAKSGDTALAVLTPNDTAPEKATIYIVGDSTASVYDDKNYPRKGWAQLLQNYFDESKINVVDYALSGRSSLSLKSDTNYTLLKNNIKSGDYLIIQFGHNDAKSDDAARYTNPNADRFTDGSFKKSILEYIELAQSVGAKPIIATSISRRKLSDASLEAYVKASRELAEELNIPLIDLYKRTNGWINEVGVETAKDMFNYVKPYDSRFIGYSGFVNSGFYTVGTTDDTHININGADLISEWAVLEMQDIGLPLAENYNSYTPVYPLPSYEYAYDTVNGTEPPATQAPTSSPSPTAKPTAAPTAPPMSEDTPGNQPTESPYKAVMSFSDNKLYITTSGINNAVLIEVIYNSDSTLSSVNVINNSLTLGDVSQYDALNIDWAEIPDGGSMKLMLVDSFDNFAPLAAAVSR